MHPKKGGVTLSNIKVGEELGQELLVPNKEVDKGYKGPF